ncbi:arylsulfatase J-like isoform X2 [Ptychodera flava]
MADVFYGLLVLTLTCQAVFAQQGKPHIVLVVIDDWGWGDVSFHGSAIYAPNIDKLAYNGIILNNYYVQSICSPSRGALMTGKYPIHIGLQHEQINSPCPFGLSLNETTLAQRLQGLGYSTHLVGKWHLGFYTERHTPTQRGFDSHFGYYNGYIDYYDRLIGWDIMGYWGYDMRRNGVLDYTTYGQYATELFTKEAIEVIESATNSSKPMFLMLSHLGVHSSNFIYPLQAPSKYVRRYPHIQSRTRRLVAGMLAAVDDSIGMVVQALKANHMYDNSIIIVTTDNGGAVDGQMGNDASNWPLRGSKHTLWEGGIRGTAFLHSPLFRLADPPMIVTEMIHISDWMPTLYHIAGGDVSDLPDNLDSFNQWDTITRGTPSQRTEILHNIDPISEVAALRVGDYKVILGVDPSNPYSDWYQPTDATKEHGKRLIPELQIRCGPKPHDAAYNCDLSKRPCLYDISRDPCEYENLADKYPDVLQRLLSRLEEYNSTAVEPLYADPDPRSDPALHNGAWVPWIGPAEEPISSTTS